MSSIQDNWNVFRQIVQEAMSKCIPTTIPKPNKTSDLRIFLKLSKLNSLILKDMFIPAKSISQYTVQRNLVKSKVHSAQISYEKSVMRNLQSNPKAFYSYVNSKQKIRSCTGPLEKADGSLISGG